ncbi:MAG: isoprenylcysteine carboxylmethyltransferase family protein [bacterium]|nr:isoprenylcysteine carboxylmethyltransferase family protein [bacterium]
MKETTNKIATGTNREELTYKVHHILAHSYTFFFSFLILGIMLDIIFKLKIVDSTTMISLGFVFLFLGTILIFWAQRTSNNLKVENMTAETFCKGPYCYTRVPTHIGLFLVALGFGFVLNATFVIITTVVSFFVNKFLFLKEEERILEQKYGRPYIEYKKKIKF